MYFPKTETAVTCAKIAIKNMESATAIEQTPNFIKDIFTFSSAKELVLRHMSKEQFISFSRRHSEFQMEREKNGTVTIMPPTAGGSSYRENTIGFYVTYWQRTQGNGMTFSSSGGFDLPSGAIKSPDVAWISPERLVQLSSEQIEESYIPIAPDFVAEIRSKSDSLKKLQKKMRETWIANGVRLAWLIDPWGQKAFIYRADGSEETVSGFDKELSGEDVLPGFLLKLKEFRVLNF